MNRLRTIKVGGVWLRVLGYFATAGPRGGVDSWWLIGDYHGPTGDYSNLRWVPLGNIEEADA